jgi:hypothetical protein
VGVDCTIHAALAAELAGDRDEILDRLGDRPACGLGKAWDAVHLALGGHDADHPLAFIETGGADIEALEDGVMAYGRYFEPAEVGAIAAALAELGDAELRANFERRDELDPDELYPRGLAPFSADDVVRHVGRLRRFLADDVITASLGILVYTSG